MICRHCKSPLGHLFLDLGFAPPSNSYLTVGDLSKSEVYFPLRVMVCESCWLVQTADFARAEELFDAEYAYFSSTSVSWLQHATSYATEIIRRLNLSANSFVVEIASNDGYLLRNFLAASIPCMGIEPTASTASAAELLGVPVLRDFFSERLGNELATKGRQADLVVANNVYAHVPDINDFTKGIKKLLKVSGTVTLEFPHLLELIKHNQFDTIYHEHFSYLSLYTVDRIFRQAGLRIWDVDTLVTHGGSLRVYGCHENDPRPTRVSVADLLEVERKHGLQEVRTYMDFQSRADAIKNDLIMFLVEQKRLGKKVAAYGAAAKGNTLLNYAGIKPDLLPFVCDAAAAKQGKFLPGSHIPILAPEKLFELVLDFLIILPWNIAPEVRKQLAYLSEAGTKFVTAVPKLEIK